MEKEPSAAELLNLTKRVKLSRGYAILKQAGAYTQLKILRRKPKEPPTKKVDSTSYVDLRTGELKEYKEHTHDDKERIKRIRKRCEQAKWKIRANEENIRLFITLTYAQEEEKPMTDTKRLYEDFKGFYARLKRLYKDIDGYMCFCEPQECGSWHCHVLLLSENKKLRIENAVMERVWGQGFTKTEKASNIIDIANYLTSYLTNLVDKNGKKSSRLHLYPSRFNFIRYSQGLKEVYEEKVCADKETIKYTLCEISQTHRVESDFTKVVELEEGGTLEYRIISFITDERAEALEHYRQTKKQRLYIKNKIKEYLRNKYKQSA